MRILDVKVDDISLLEALKKIKDFLIDNQQHYIVTPNPEIVLLAQKDGDFKKILNKADLTIPDGIGLIFASKILCCSLKHRITGVDLFKEICSLSDFSNFNFFLLGGKNNTAKRVIKNLHKLNPELKIESSEEIDDMAVKKINQFQSQILFVALGAPKQEKWIYNNLDKLPSVRVAMTVGGAFDFISGDIKRAPVWAQRLGLEWLWRLIIQPWRMGRIYNAVIKFSLLVIKSKFIKVKVPKVKSQ